MSVASLIFYFLYGMLTVMLALRDYQAGLLPDKLTCPLLWSGMLFHVIVQPQRLPSSVLGAIAGYGTLAIIYWLYRGLRHKEGLGYGDVKFFAALGAWNGWEGLPMLITLATGFALLFACGLAVIGRSLLLLKNPLPFGPFLSAAGLVMACQNGFILPL